MTGIPILRSEAIVGDYLYNHPEVVAMKAKIGGKIPNKTRFPWVRITQLDAQNSLGSRPEWLVAYFLQLDCYAGADSQESYVAQSEALNLAIMVRHVLSDMPEAGVEDAVVTSVKFTSMPRIPDESFDPARERYVLDTTIHMHPNP